MSSVLGAGLCAIAIAALVAAPSTTAAQDVGHRIHLDGQASFVVGGQSDLFQYGGGGRLGYELVLGGLFGIELAYGGVLVSEVFEGGAGYGSLHGPILSLLAHVLPRDTGVDLWIAAGAGLGITGELLRPWLQGRLGLGFFLAPEVALGPFATFDAVLQSDESEGGPGHALLVSGGLRLSFTPGASAPVSGAAPTSDPNDRCPAEAEDLDGFQDDDGCPDPDNDGDGVLDAQDQCPLQPFEGPDADGDGCTDPVSEDHCPDEPEDLDGFQDDDGCPDPDNDEDGVPDDFDECPTEPGPGTANGCPGAAPEEAAPVLEPTEAAERPVAEEPPAPRTPEEAQENTELEALAERILFARNSTRLTPRARAIVARIAQFLRDHPTIQRVRIEGHASPVGSEARNEALSRERAEAVAEQLAAAGIDRGRLQVEGHGAERPDVEGTSPRAQRLNQRVMVHVMERE